MKKTTYEKSLQTELNKFAPDVLDKIKQSDQFYVPEKTKKRLFPMISSKRLGYTFASLVVLFVLAITLASQGNTTPVVASTVTIDINPSILIELDEDDFVIGISAINSDGDLLIDRNINYRGITLDKAVEFVIQRAHERGYIVDNSTDNVVLISVGSNQLQIKERLEQALEAKIRSEIQKYAANVTVEKGNTNNISGNQLTDLENQAEINKISVAKLILVKQIITLDESYQISDLKDMSIRELYNLRNGLENPETNDNQNPQGNGNPNK